MIQNSTDYTDETMSEQTNSQAEAAVEETLAEAQNPAPHRNGDGPEAAAEGSAAEGSTAGEDAAPESGTEGAGEVVVETAEETIARLESELAAAQARADEAVDRMQRTVAEFQNTRRRQDKLVQDSLERSTQRLLGSLLPVMDDFNLAFQNLPDALTEEETAWVDGFRRIHDKLTSILADEGMAAIEDSGPFDPNLHEAVTNEPSDEVESGHIISTLRTGYIFKDRVLRPALVRVAQ